MTLSGPFIRRPVATLLLSIGVLLLGVVAYAMLPIAALPNVDRPTIGVYAGIPGASADTIAASVAQPLERQLGTIPGIAEMASFSAPGGTEITIQFDLATDIDAAAGAVQAAINAAGPNLPNDLPQPPTYWKANPSGFAAISLAMTSDVLDPSAVYDYADSVVAEEIAQLPGVAKVNVAGADRSAVRIRVQPRQLAGMKLSLEDVRAAVQAATQNLPKGSFTTGDVSFAIGADDQLIRAADYADIVIASRNGAPVRLRDVAVVTDSVINDRLAGWVGDGHGVVLLVYKQLDANVVRTVDAVKALLPQIKRVLPPTIRLQVMYDRTTLIRAAISDVQKTIAIAILLVVLVVGLFLRRAWATAIPVFTIPVALAATLAVMALAGYSLDNLSLMAITIAIGFVVDDAVIIVENVIRRMEEGADAAQAALDSARQMGFTIVAITGALVAALIPVLLMPDIVGRYFREFGMTLAAAIVASAIVSLTLTPMLCSRLLRRGGGRQAKRDGWALRAYLRSLDWTLRHPGVIALVLLAVMGGSAGLYLALPKGFMPTQDTGILRVRSLTIANVSFAAMEKLQNQAVQAVLRDPAVDGLTAYVGSNNGSTVNNGYMWANLRPLDQRPPIGQVVARLRAALAGVDGIRVFFTPLQDLNVGAQESASRYQYTLTGIDPAEVARWAEVMRRRIRALPDITDVVSSDETSGLQAGLQIDRLHAAAMGITPLAIDNTLYDAFGQRQIRTIYLPSNYSRVILEVDPAAQADPSVLAQIYVPGSGGQAPLAALTQRRRAHAAMWIRHDDQFPASTISFDMKPGKSIGAGIAAIRATARAAHLPDDIRAEFKGEAEAAQKSGAQQMLLFLGAIFAVYVVLGMLYESYAHPLTILSTLPSALFGALLALWATGTEFTLIAAIACVLLVGMVMKNAIMMVDFALAAQRREGLDARAAIARAARLRVRPIVMTTLVAMFGAVPLAVGLGAGHELRQPLGIASIGGLAASQLLTLYTTPVVFLLIARLGTRRAGRMAPTANQS